MTVLVAAASEHGASREIATRIADELARRDMDAEVKAPELINRGRLVTSEPLAKTSSLEDVFLELTAEDLR